MAEGPAARATRLARRERALAEWERRRAARARASLDGVPFVQRSAADLIAAAVHERAAELHARVAELREEQARILR
jgi:hypothetical protein